MADHRPDVYRERDRWIVRASSMSYCTQRLVAQGLGHERMAVPETVQRGYDEGAGNEERLLRMWRNPELAGEVIGPYSDRFAGKSLPKWKGLDANDPASYMQKSSGGILFPHCRHDYLSDGQFTVEWKIGNAVLRGHMDGVGQCYQADVDSGMVGTRVVEEGKLLGPDYWKKWLNRGWAAFPHYAMQVSVYGHATGLPVAFIVGEKVRKDDGTVSIPRIHVTWLENDELPVSKGAVVARALKIARLCEAGDLGEVGGCDRDDWPCPVSYLHDGTRAGVVIADGEGLPMVEVENGKIDEFLAALGRYETVAQIATAAEKDKKAAGKVLADVVEACGVDKDTRTLVRGGGREVEWYVEERKGYTVADTVVRYAKVKKARVADIDDEKDDV